MRKILYTDRNMRLCLLVASALAVLQAEDWSRFRGPNGSGLASGKGYVTEFGPNRNLIWRTPVRAGKSSPVLTRTRVFLTGFEADRLYTLCYDRATGQLLWEQSEPRKRTDGVHHLNHPAAISPVTDGENVYVFFKDFGVLSYTSAGKLRWRVPFDATANTMGLGASPILADDLLIIQVDQFDKSFIAAYSKSNGELRWKAARDESQSWSTPIVHQAPGEPMQIITASSGRIDGNRVSDGKRMFSQTGASPVMVASPILDGNTVLAFGYGYSVARPFAAMLEQKDKNKDGKINRDEYNEIDTAMSAIGRYLGNRDGDITEDEWLSWGGYVGGSTGLVALDLSSPEPERRWRVEKGFESVIPSPIVHDGLVYVVKNGGILTAYDAKTGQVAKTGRIAGALGGYSASPVVAENRLYFASEEGKISVVRPGRDWELIQLNDIGDPFYATPAPSNGQIFARGSEALYCFGAKP
jgi:outer membrane protein assembly factor BamB